MLLQTGTRTLDRIRAEALRRLLQFHAVRHAYTHRTWRLAILHALFAVGALLFALSYPLWQLILGPVLFGYAHLVATIRFVPAAVERRGHSTGMHRKLLLATLAAGSLHIVYRFALDAGWFANHTGGLSEWQGLGPIDGLFIAAVCALIGMILGGAKRAFSWRIFALAPLLCAIAFAPLQTAGALILLHNFIAYLYWVAIARSPEDRKTGALALLGVSVVTGLLLSGAMDSLLVTGSTNSILVASGLSIESLGQSIAPTNSDPTHWARLVAAFAFGQSCHYFVWLKAIPESRQKKRTPHTASNCLRSMERELTRDGAHVVLYALGISILLWTFVAIPDMRRFYFLAAGFHGLVELAMLPHLLPFATRSRSRSKK